MYRLLLLSSLLLAGCANSPPQPAQPPVTLSAVDAVNAVLMVCYFSGPVLNC